MYTKTSVPVAQSEPQMFKRRDLIEELRENLENLWQHPWFPFEHQRGRPGGRLAAWMPSMDVLTKDGELILKVDLPGMKKDEVQVFIEDGDLVLKGERKHSTEVKQEDYYRCEREYGEFYRRLALPFEADPSLIAAKFSDGVLEVKIPMPVERKVEHKRIDVM